MVRRSLNSLQGRHFSWVWSRALEWNSIRGNQELLWVESHFFLPHVLYILLVVAPYWLGHELQDSDLCSRSENYLVNEMGCKQPMFLLLKEILVGFWKKKHNNKTPWQLRRSEPAFPQHFYVRIKSWLKILKKGVFQKAVSPVNVLNF